MPLNAALDFSQSMKSYQSPSCKYNFRFIFRILPPCFFTIKLITSVSSEQRIRTVLKRYEDLLGCQL